MLTWDEERRPSGRSWSDYVGPGWRDIVDHAVGEIEARGGSVQQVKEKFGGLRIYAHGDGAEEICDEAEQAAKNLCEECGKPGKCVDLQGWFKTRCDDHLK